MSIERTTVGSFPRRNTPLENAIRNVVTIQLKYGIDVITDGEQRSDMITYFEQIPGLSIGPKGLRVSGKIASMDYPNEFYKIKDHATLRSILSTLNRSNLKTKVTITGPVTLGMTAAFGGLEGYSSIRDPTLYSDCADALLPLAERVLSDGALLQIDEPGISARFESPKHLERLLSALPDKAVDDGKVSIHVCGSIKHVYDELMALSVNVYSFGFSREKESENIGIVSRDFIESGKRLGIGFISNVSIEDVDTALKRLRRISEIIGVDSIAYVHPDCGFANTSPERVEHILSNMHQASDRFLRYLV